MGCGKMGGALLGGWLDQRIAGTPDRPVAVIEPNEAAMKPFAGAANVARATDAKGLKPSVVVLAIKPQMMDAALGALAGVAESKPLFLSIAAGKTLAYFAKRLGTDAAVVRAMPNTPAAVGRGVTVAVANPHVAPAMRETAQALLAAVSEVHWVADEGLLDAVTAVSGGGPAYVFLLIEALAEAGRQAGLPADLAMRLARVTVSGSGELARQSSEAPAALRQNVTSPGGTTLEALKILMAPDGLQPLFNRAIAAATKRSRELAG